MKRRLVKFLVMVVLWSHSTAIATLQETTPSEVCKYLNAHGLVTGPWKDYGPGGGAAGSFGCNSSYKELGSGFGIQNNVAYYVEGQPKKVGRLYLVLNVNNRSQASTAHETLLGAAVELAAKTTGKPLPGVIRKAISSGSKASATSDGTRIRVIRFDWPTGKGYELKVYFE